MNNKLKQLIRENLTSTSLSTFKGLNSITPIDSNSSKLLSMTCFWSKVNFSAILKYYGIKYYCYYDNSTNDIIIERV